MLTIEIHYYRSVRHVKLELTWLTSGSNLIAFADREGFIFDMMRKLKLLETGLLKKSSKFRQDG